MIYWHCPNFQIYVLSIWSLDQSAAQDLSNTLQFWPPRIGILIKSSDIAKPCHDMRWRAKCGLCCRHGRGSIENFGWSLADSYTLVNMKPNTVRNRWPPINRKGFLENTLGLWFLITRFIALLFRGYKIPKVYVFSSPNC